MTFIINNVIDFIFLFLAVRWGYVDKSTFSFVLVPIVIAFFVGILTFVGEASNNKKALKGKKALNKEELNEEELKEKELENVEALNEEVPKAIMGEFVKRVKKVSNYVESLKIKM